MNRLIDNQIPWVFTLFLLFSTISILRSQSSASVEAEIDSLLSLLPVQNDSVSIYLYKTLTRRYHSLGDQEKVDETLQICLETAKNTGSPRLLADAYHNFSYIHIQIGNYDTAFYFATQMLLAAQQANYPERLSSAYNNIGKAHEYRGDFLSARKAFIEAEKINIKYGFKVYTAYEQFNIGMLNWRLHNYEEALTYFNKLALGAAQQRDTLIQDRLWRMAHYGKANVLLDQGQVDQAIAIYQEVIKRDPTPGIYAFTTAESLAKLGQAHLWQEKWELAEQHLLQAIDNQKETKIRKGLGTTENLLSQVYLKQKRISKALEAATRAYTIGQNLAAKEIIQTAAMQLSKIYALQQQMDNAFHYQTIALMYKDSIFDSSKTRDFLELEAKYESELNAQEIHSLKQENKIQQLHNDNQTRQLIVGGILLLFLTALAIVLYLLYQLKHRSNTKIQSQNLIIQQALEEKEILMQEIHHRAKNNLAIIESLLSLETKQTGDQDAKMALQESKSRVQTIRLIHQQLYGNNANITVEIGDYFKALVSQIRDAIMPDNITIKLTVDDINLGINQTVPLGLLVNEAITNSVKYAFNSRAMGEITIKLMSLAPGRLQLLITDDGIGFTHAPNYNQSANNFSLINGLTRQLNGKMTIQNQVGTTINIIFPHQEIGILGTSQKMSQ